MVVGNTCEIADQDFCNEMYAFVQNGQSVRSTSDYLTFPNARKYVQRLMAEEPEATEPLKHRLAVVAIAGINSYKNSVGYYVAEELALAAQMDIVLVGGWGGGGNPEDTLPKLEEASQCIMDEFRRRFPNNEDEKRKKPKLYMIPMQSNSLISVAAVAEEINAISNLSYQGQLHVLANLGGEVSEFYGLTDDGVERNMGCNYLAPRLFADLLLPPLRAAAVTNKYKPRLIQEASVGHCRGGDFDPFLLQKYPKEGGISSNDGFVVKGKEEVQATTTEQELESTSSSTTGLDMFHRSKMALMVDTLGLSKEEPMLAVVTCDPGILTYAATPPPSLSNATTRRASTLTRRKSLSSRVLDLNPSQAARSALRAALDPAFNTIEMPYLHSDGNPWRMYYEPTASTTTTAIQGCGDLEEYAEIVRTVGDELSGKLIADTDCEWELWWSSGDDSYSSSSMLGSSSSSLCWSPMSSPAVSRPSSPFSSMLNNNKEDIMLAVPAPPLETPAVMKSSMPPQSSSSSAAAAVAVATKVPGSCVWGRAFTSLLSQ